MKTVALIVTLLFSATGISQQQPTKPNDVAMDKWRAMIPAIENTLKEHNLHCDYPGGPWAPSIADAADFSSTDHMTAALVDWCNGGAYSDAILAVNLQDGKPVLSRFLNANNQEQRVGFLSGSSVMHSVGVKLVREKTRFLTLIATMRKAKVFSIVRSQLTCGTLHCGRSSWT
jgi:hypothetical protein